MVDVFAIFPATLNTKSSPAFASKIDSGTTRESAQLNTIA